MLKIRQATGPRRVRSYAFVVSNILNIMSSLNLINLLINRAREAALGTRFSKRTPPPSRFRTHSEPPLEEPFGPPWPPKVPTLPPHVDFGVILGPPLDPKWDLRAHTGGQREPKRLVLRVAFEVPFASWIRLVVQRVPASHYYRLWGTLG